VKGTKDALAGKYFVQNTPRMIGQVRDRISEDLYLVCVFGETVADSQETLVRLAAMAQHWVFFGTKRRAIEEWKRRA